MSAWASLDRLGSRIGAQAFSPPPLPPNTTLTYTTIGHGTVMSTMWRVCGRKGRLAPEPPPQGRALVFDACPWRWSSRRSPRYKSISRCVHRWNIQEQEGPGWWSRQAGGFFTLTFARSLTRGVLLSGLTMDSIKCQNPSVYAGQMPDFFCFLSPSGCIFVQEKAGHTAHKQNNFPSS